MSRPWMRSFAVVPVLLIVTALLTAAPVVPTTITVEAIDCQGCAKRIVTRLAAVPGVASVQTDLKAATATVQPKEAATPSPRALWEAMEKSGHKPVKLQGPAGTFTAKPAS